jgi:hypothetical protein
MFSGLLSYYRQTSFIAFRNLSLAAQPRRLAPTTRRHKEPFRKEILTTKLPCAIKNLERAVIGLVLPSLFQRIPNLPRSLHPSKKRVLPFKLRPYRPEGQESLPILSICHFTSYIIHPFLPFHLPFYLLHYTSLPPICHCARYSLGWPVGISGSGSYILPFAYSPPTSPLSSHPIDSLLLQICQSQKVCIEYPQRYCGRN